MRPKLSLLLALSLSCTLWAAPDALAIEDGMYLSLGIGYASVSGTRGQDITFDDRTGCAPAGSKFLWLEEPNQCFTAGLRARLVGKSVDDYLHEVVRTEFGQGIGTQLRLGWNIKGYVSPELALLAHGSTAGNEGAALPSLRARIHPAEFFIPHDKRDWDASVFLGGGLAIGGYAHPEDYKAAENDDGKGWTGWNFSFGASFNYALAEVFSLGLDLNAVQVGYVTWIVSWDDNVHSLTKKTPSTWVISPTLQMTFHLGDGEPKKKPNRFDHVDDSLE